ncbi:helix-turn-helix domain-containing protein [Nocardia acidivorans]|uniref:helix-turn-helix domain-containing protein n=1 Tax=Nocardia acidivorans TaxID=404580 RepID=UPI00082E19F4|nr:helix-turn-helix transcriptional regulator [Nocardia acidivorans]
MKQWEFGRLLQTARETAGLSKREAAKRAGISESRWRQLEAGYELIRKQTFPVKTTPETVAQVAASVGASRDELLEAAGFDPAMVDIPDAVIVKPVDVAGLTTDNVEKVRAFVAFLKSQQEGDASE